MSNATQIRAHLDADALVAARDLRPARGVASQHVAHTTRGLRNTTNTTKIHQHFATAGTKKRTFARACSQDCASKLFMRSAMQRLSYSALMTQHHTYTRHTRVPKTTAKLSCVISRGATNFMPDVFQPMYLCACVVFTC